jgi:hypothetical protein
MENATRRSPVGVSFGVIHGRPSSSHVARTTIGAPQPSHGWTFV